MKNILFDLDGTLWDARTTLADTWNIVLQKFNVLPKPLTAEDLSPFMGLILEDILPVAFPDLKREQYKEIANEVLQQENKNVINKGGILYDGVKETLEKLAQTHDLFIVSNCQNGYIEAFLEYFKFHHLFKDFESAGRTGKNKAENIALVLERNKISFENAVYVGDTQTDFNSSKANNLKFIFAEYGFGDVEEKENVVVLKQFSELKKHFEL